MDHGGEAARPATVGSTNLGMAAAVHGGEAHMTTGTFHGQLGAAAARRASFEPTAATYLNSAEFARHVGATASSGAVPVAVFHREPGPGGAYVVVVLVGQQLPDRVVLLHDSYFDSAPQPHPGAGPGVMLAALLPRGVGVVYNGDYALQPRPGAGPAYDGSRALAGDLGAVYENRGMVAEQHLRRLLSSAGIGSCSLAVNGLAAGPGSPVVAFHLFVLLLGGLFLVILHVLRV